MEENAHALNNGSNPYDGPAHRGAGDGAAGGAEPELAE